MSGLERANDIIDDLLCTLGWVGLCAPFGIPYAWAYPGLTQVLAIVVIISDPSA